jgi:hypothetical protein
MIGLIDCRCDQLRGRLSARFFEVKLEGKIPRISRINEMRACPAMRHAAQKDSTSEIIAAP